ncbi:class I SAM-dependent methyltransferase [Tenacibaculum sp. K20-16]|nr:MULTISPECIES: class I SAM-dependent methyltransferase [Tenacibaculum]MCH3881352.1 class I SAM-dependent methyltransferase [Tenacibaculum aquimarinum]MDO6599054.1 class I SAM-dependent methyltransferase [Tenacibaculum sp. 1_MG-2023]
MNTINFYNNTKPYLTTKDYSVSKEVFELEKNEEFDMLVTIPVPKNLSSYYESENYISHTDGKKGVFEKVYQLVKNYTLKRKLKLINSFNSEEKTILDIGAGTGDFLATCKNDNWQVLGIEPNKKAREIAASKNITLQENISIVENKKFDVITLWHVLEHVENLEEYIQQLKALLKENGTLIIAVPNYKSYDANHYKKYWAAFDVPRHLWHFSQTSISKLFSKENITIVKTLPMKFDSYYVSLLSERYKNGKMNPFKAFWIGFTSNRKAKKTNEYSSLIYVLKNK